MHAPSPVVAADALAPLRWWALVTLTPDAQCQLQAAATTQTEPSLVDVRWAAPAHEEATRRLAPEACRTAPQNEC